MDEMERRLLERRLKDYEDKLERTMRNHASIEAEYIDAKRRYQNSKFNIKQLENDIELLRGLLNVSKTATDIGVKISNHYRR